MGDNGRLVEYYEQRYVERDRLGRREGQLEFVRTLELLARFLPPVPAKIVDVGGGTGTYASQLVALGHNVLLVDIVPAHVQEAAQQGAYRATVGDARALPLADDCCDVALLLGPLYHLLTAEERLAALREARRIVTPGGLVVAAFISRGAVVLDGYVKGWIDRPGTIDAVREHVRGGSSTTYAQGFGQIAYFHLPSEARVELEAADLEILAIYGVEGPGWIAHDFTDRWQRPESRDLILESARICEEEPELQTLSPHLLAFGRRF